MSWKYMIHNYEVSATSAKHVFVVTPSLADSPVSNLCLWIPIYIYVRLYLCYSVTHSAAKCQNGIYLLTIPTLKRHSWHNLLIARHKTFRLSHIMVPHNHRNNTLVVLQEGRF